MIVDANLLLYAVDESSTHNAAAAAWLEETLDGDSRVGPPWQTIGASSGSSHIRESPKTRCPLPARGDTRRLAGSPCGVDSTRDSAEPSPGFMQDYTHRSTSPPISSLMHN